MNSELLDDRVGILLRSKGRLLHFLERRLGNRADAEDLLQTAMLRLLARGDSLREEDKLTPWFYQLLRNLVLDHFRHRSTITRMEQEVAAETATNTAADPDLFQAVCACVNAVLAALKPDQAELIRRVELDEESLQGVARHLGITPNNASVRLHRARRALRDALQATCGICAEHGCLDCGCGQGGQPRIQ